MKRMVILMGLVGSLVLTGCDEEPEASDFMPPSVQFETEPSISKAVDMLRGYIDGNMEASRKFIEAKFVESDKRLFEAESMVDLLAKQLTAVDDKLEDKLKEVGNMGTVVMELGSKIEGILTRLTDIEFRLNQVERMTGSPGNPDVETNGKNLAINDGL